MNMLERARRAAPHFREHASRNEQLGRLADPVVAELEAGGFFGLFTPRAVGGAELPPVEAVEVIEELARADASTAWVTFAVGLCTGAERKVIQTYEASIRNKIDAGDYVGAFRVFDELLNGDFYHDGTYVLNITQLSDYFNWYHVST